MLNHSQSFHNLTCKISALTGVKALGYGLDGPGSIPGVGSVDIFFSLRVQSGPEVHPASYEMSTGDFPRA